MKLSYEQLKDKLRAMMPGMYIMEMFDDHVICEKNNSEPSPQYCKVEYSVDDDGNVTMKEPVAVQREYVPVKAMAAMRFTAAADATSEDYGYKWGVQIINAGPDKQGRFDYPLDVIHAAASLYEGAPVFCLAEAQHTAGKHPFGKSVKDIVGRISDVKPNATGNGGVFTILKSARWFRDMLVDAYEQGMVGKEGQKDLIELSHDVIGKTIKAAGSISRVAKIVKVDGVDVVYDAIGGGKFLRMAASRQDREGQKEDSMYKRLLAALKGMRPDLGGKIAALEAKGENVTDADIQQLMAAAMPEQSTGDFEKLIAALKGEGSTIDEAKKLLDQARIVACGTTLTSELKESGLPALSQARLKKQFDGKAFETETLQAAIKDEKEYLDKLTGSGVVIGAGGERIDVQAEPERLQAAMDQMFGVKVDPKFDIAPFESLKAAYVRLTGDANVSGHVDRERLKAGFDSGTFSYVLGNTMYRRMVQDYKEANDFGVSRLISSRRNAKDFRTIESVRIAYYGDIPDVNPEAADYADLGQLSDEEVSYALNQKGGLVIVTRKMIINDDMSAVSKIISRLPRAARRTRAKRIWNKFLSNATYKGDSKSVFHADHGNLGSAAYSIASALAAKTAMAQQTEAGSGERLMLKPVTVAFPTELYNIVKNVNDFNPQAVEIANGNSMFGFFKPEGIIESPFMTDATDWMMFADPNEVEIIEVAYLNGQEEPEMFVADNPVVGQTFVADKMTYKIRMEDECEIVDYRGAYKAVVAN